MIIVYALALVATVVPATWWLHRDLTRAVQHRRPETHMHRRQVERTDAPRSTGRFRHLAVLLWPYVRSEWRLVALALGSVLAASAVALARPWPIKILVDDVLQVGHGALSTSSTTVDLITLVVGAVLVIALLQGLFGFLETLCLTAAGQRISTRIRSAVFAHLHRLPMAFHDRQRTGDLVTRVTSDVSRVQENVLDDLLVIALARVIQVGGILTVMLFIDWRVGLVACATVPMTSLTSLWFRRRIRARESRVRSHEGDMASMAQETISAMRTVKALGRHDVETRRFDDASEDMMSASIHAARLEAAFGWALTLVAAVSVAAVIGFGSRQVLTGALSAGTLIVFVQYMRDLQGPLLGLSRLQAKLAKASVRLERILEVLEEPLGAVQNPSARPVPGRLAGHVQFEGIGFGYNDARPVLSDVDLVLQPGEVVAVVGPSGSGKTTLASLLLRLYTPTAGRVLVDGVDLGEYTVDSYTSQTAVVLQETLLFRATVEENIAYGRPGATHEEIRAAAELAAADDFIRALPEGYSTIVGERGATLSGGQRQRIAIARALVRDAPILVLDEPTTGLDPDAEEAVLSALETLMRGRTTLLVTHRQSTICRADRVVTIQDGCLVEPDTVAISPIAM
jgi:ATP-binding cassette, subfamily B, bacterial